MPDSPEKNAYEVLGVNRTASLDDVKKRYRELARQFHPDVNPGNPNAAKRFADLTHAYKTLSDTTARANHDAELNLREQRAARATAAKSAPASSNPTTVRPTTTTANAGGNRLNESLRLAGDAQTALARGRIIEARSLAEQSLRLNRRNEKAYEILGDIYSRQGKTEEAINMYSMAVQLNPRNTVVLQRLERLSRLTGGLAGPTAQRVFFDNSSSFPEPPVRNPSRPVPAGNSSQVADPMERREALARFATGFIGYSSVGMLLVYTALYHGGPPNGQPLLAFVSTWNVTLITMMALCGAILGATMTLTRSIRRIEDELLFTGVGAARTGTFLPIGLIVIVVSALNFYIAAAVYTITSLMQEAFTRSMGRVLVAVAILTGVFALIYPPGTLQVFLWGGNVIFICYIIGWLLGDFFRE